MIENKLLPRHFFGGYIFDIARRDPCRSLKLFESLVEALLALELQAFCESVPGISQFVLGWLQPGRGGGTWRQGSHKGAGLCAEEPNSGGGRPGENQSPKPHVR